jgi:hypothetical protein
MRGGARCVAECFSRIRGRTRKGGYIRVIQRHGRKGQDTPHLHCMATSGGWEQQAQQWVPLEYVPYPRLRPKWPWHLLTRLRQTVQTRESQRGGAVGYTRYREGLVTAACLPPRLPADTLLRGAGAQDLGHAAGRDAGGLSHGPGPHPGRAQHHRPHDLPSTISAEYGAGPLTLSALSP